MVGMGSVGVVGRCGMSSDEARSVATNLDPVGLDRLLATNIAVSLTRGPPPEQRPQSNTKAKAQNPGPRFGRVPSIIERCRGARRQTAALANVGLNPRREAGDRLRPLSIAIQHREHRQELHHWEAKNGYGRYQLSPAQGRFWTTSMAPSGSTHLSRPSPRN